MTVISNVCEIRLYLVNSQTPGRQCHVQIIQYVILYCSEKEFQCFASDMEISDVLQAHVWQCSCSLAGRAQLYNLTWLAIRKYKLTASLSLSLSASSGLYNKKASYIIIIIDKPSSVHVQEPINTEHAPLGRKYITWSGTWSDGVLQPALQSISFCTTYRDEKLVRKSTCTSSPLNWYNIILCSSNTEHTKFVHQPNGCQRHWSNEHTHTHIEHSASGWYTMEIWLAVYICLKDDHSFHDSLPNVTHSWARAFKSSCGRRGHLK